jgi:hypothetical protein
MKALKILLTVILVMVIIFFAFSWWIGAFTTINLQDKQSDSYVIVGSDYVGDYSKVSETMMQVDKKLKDLGINCKRGFGIYYDNPKNTPKEKCRSFVGNIIEEKDFAKLAVIKDAGLKVDSVGEKNSLIIEFPFKNKLSYMVGPLKAYPALMKHADQNHYKASLIMEVYDMPQKMILYIMQYNK